MYAISRNTSKNEQISLEDVYETKWDNSTSINHEIVGPYKRHTRKTEDKHSIENTDAKDCLCHASCYGPICDEDCDVVLFEFDNSSDNTMMNLCYTCLRDIQSG